MRHRRDTLLLQKGGLAHQRPGGDEQHPAAAAAQQLWQDMPTEYGGAAARARTAAFYPLLPGIVKQTAAVRVVFQQQTLCCQQLPQHLTAHQPKVAGVDAVEIPVIAAGGIADGRGIAAAFMLGAEGVQIGTRFVVTEEAQVHENYKECILKARDIDSRVTGRSTGHPVRALRNKMTKEYLEKEQAGATFEELEHLTLGGLRRAVVDGDVQSGSVMAGQIAGMIKEKLTCQEVIQKLVSQTDELIGGKGFYE